MTVQEEFCKKHGISKEAMDKDIDKWKEDMSALSDTLQKHGNDHGHSATTMTRLTLMSSIILLAAITNNNKTKMYEMATDMVDLVNGTFNEN